MKRDSSTFTRFLRAFLTHCSTQSLARCLFNVVTRRRPRARLKKEELSGSAHGTQSASYLPAVPSLLLISPSSLRVLSQMEIPSRTFDPELPRSTFSLLDAKLLVRAKSTAIRFVVPRETRLLKKITTLDTIDLKTEKFKRKEGLIGEIYRVESNFLCSTLAWRIEVGWSGKDGRARTATFYEGGERIGKVSGRGRRPRSCYGVWKEEERPWRKKGRREGSVVHRLDRREGG